jgi:putative peptidoglycan lipid II flippase
MVKRLLSLFHREISGLHEAAYLLAAFSFISQILALVRDRLLAHTFGAGADLDIYYAAFRLPDFIYVTAGSLISISVLVPLFAEQKGKGEAAVRRSVNAVFTWFGAMVTAAALIGFFAAPFLLPYLFPGFSAEALGETTKLTRILLLSPMLLGISNFFAGITQSFRKYLPYALSPVLYNLGIIIGIAFLYPLWGIEGLAWGVIIGAALHMAIELPSVAQLRLLPRLVRAPFSEIRSTLLLSIPRTIALGMSQLATLGLLAFASLIGAGSIAIFNLAWNLQSVPVSLVGVSYSLAAFPTLSALYASGDQQGFNKKVAIAMRHIIFWTVPISVLFIVLRAQIVRTVLGTGNFSWSDTRLTAAVLAMFAVSVTAQSISMLLIRAFYATGNTRISFWSAIIEGAGALGFAFVFFSAFNHYDFVRYFLESLLRIEGIPGSAIITLPAAFAMGALVQAARLWIMMRRKHVQELKEVAESLGQVFSASIIMGFVAYLSLNAWAPVFDLDTLSGIFLQGFLSGLVGIGAFYVVMRLMKSKELDDITGTLRARIWKSAVIAPEQPEL